MLVRAGVVARDLQQGRGAAQAGTCGGGCCWLSGAGTDELTAGADAVCKDCRGENEIGEAHVGIDCRRGLTMEYLDGPGIGDLGGPGIGDDTLTRGTEIDRDLSIRGDNGNGTAACPPRSCLAQSIGLPTEWRVTEGSTSRTQMAGA